MSGWEKTTLGELVDIKHGYAFKGDFFTEIPNGNALLTPGNFHIGGGFKADKFKYYTGDFPEEYVLSPGDVIVTMTDLSKEGDTLGYSARIPEDTNRFLHNQRLGLVSTISNKADINFLYWLLRTSHYQKTIVNSCSGSTVKHTSPSRIKSYEFLLPPIAEQIAIDKVLSSLDRKIENLRRQNETLERIAQTLFKHWFVDFEFPNEDGKPYKSSGGEMVRSELGEIPAGWQLGRLGDVTNINGESINNGYKHKNVEYIDISSVGIGVLEGTTSYNLKDAPSRARRLVKHGDVIWSGVRPNRKSYLFISHPPKNLVVSTGFITLTPVLIPSSYLYSWVTTDSFVEYLTFNASGSAYPAVKAEHFEIADILLPDKSTLNKFHAVVDPMRDKIHQNTLQIQTLTKTRNVLLPKLMSGKLRITE